MLGSVTLRTCSEMQEIIREGQGAITWHNCVQVGEEQDGVDAVVCDARQPAPPALLETPEGAESCCNPGHIPAGEMRKHLSARSAREGVASPAMLNCYGIRASRSFTFDAC